MSMSTQAVQLREHLRQTFKPHMTGTLNISGTRAQVEALAGSLPPAPEDIQISTTNLAEIPGERLIHRSSRTNRVILYLHGGGWNSGLAQVVRPVTWRLAKKAEAIVYAINYRLAPEYPYPAGLDDCVQAYDALLQQGFPASSIIVAGDSAGGNLTLALALRLKSEGKPLPAALVCLSPNTDLTCSSDSITANVDSDALITPAFLEAIARVYSPEGDFVDPLLSPLYGDLAGLPPTYFLASDVELLVDDSRRMAEKMKAANVEVVLDIWPELWHDWPTFSDQVPEGEEALEKIARFITNILHE